MSAQRTQRPIGERNHWAPSVVALEIWQVALLALAMIGAALAG